MFLLLVGSSSQWAWVRSYTYNVLSKSHSKQIPIKSVRIQNLIINFELEEVREPDL
jgi:hypothetical protein